MDGAGRALGRSGRRRGAVPALTIVVAAAAYLLLFGPTLWELVIDWTRNGEYGHGLLFLPIALFLAWKARLPEREPARFAGLAVVVAGALLFLLGTVAAEFFTRRMAALAALGGLVLYYRGGRQLRAWWLPFALMAFAIPLPQVVLASLTLPLQLVASETAVTLLQFRHVPAEVAGNVILLPGHELFVAEACSGLRSISALLGMALLIGGTGLRGPGSRLLLLAFAVPAALAANVLRVFGSGYAVYLWGPGVAEGAAHEAMGAVVFLLALLLVGGLAAVLRRRERRGDPQTTRSRRSRDGMAVTLATSGARD